MITLNDLEKIEGIEFYEYLEADMNVEVVRVGTPLDIVSFLVSKFKAELTMIGKKYAFNENDKDFIPLRKYYASAIKHSLLTYNLEDDVKFNILKKEIGYGLEFVYYYEVLIPSLINTLSKRFFVDATHPLLYSSQEHYDEPSFTNFNFGKYGYFKYSIEISNALNPNREPESTLSTDAINDIFKDSKLFEKTWTNEYNARLSIIYSVLTQKYIETNESTKITSLLKGTI